jgi:hypothetical protein
VCASLDLTTSPAYDGKMIDCPLARTAALGTDYWNDSCSLEELTYAVERGAVGATSFRRAYEPDGMSVDEFDTYGATVRGPPDPGPPT